MIIFRMTTKNDIQIHTLKHAINKNGILKYVNAIHRKSNNT